MARRPPEVVHVAITCADDTLAIMAIVTCEYAGDGTVAWRREASAAYVDATIAKAARSFDADKRPVKGWRPIDPRDVPADRTFRNALRDNGTQLAHDLEHAKRLHRDHLRQARAPQLAALDVAYQRADESQDPIAKAQIAAAKQALRDLPASPMIDAATTVDELKAIWPKDLS